MIARPRTIAVALVTASLSRRGGGISAAVESLSRALAGIDGLDVRVFGLEDDTWLDGNKHEWKGASATAFRVIGPRALGYAPEMARALVDWAPDIVHTHGLWMHPTRSVLQWANSSGLPHIVSPHGMLDPWALQNSALRKRFVGVLYEHEHLRSAAVLHALCGPEETAIRSFGLRQPIHVVPNGVDSPITTPVPAAPWGALGSPQKKVMLFLGRLHPKKNVLAFLQAWASARSKRRDGADWCLVIAGWDQGGYAATLHAAIERLRLSEEVLLLGPLFGSEKDAALRNASAFVLPSLSEGLPMAVLEAWSYGLPVLMTEACNLDRAFALGAARCLDFAADRMAEDLAAFLSLPEEDLRNIGKRGRAWMEQDFTWDSIARRMADVYREVVESARRIGSVRTFR